MTVASWIDLNSTSQLLSTWKAGIDGNAMVAKRIVDAFAPHEAATPALTVLVDAGSLFSPGSGTTTERGQQTVSGFVATASTQRIDLVVIDAASGAASRVAGVESGSPVAPSIPAGKLPCAQVGPFTTTTTTITNSMITDMRSPVSGLGGGGTVSGNLTVTGNLAVNGNTTLGDAAGDAIAFNAAAWTMSNPTAVTFTAGQLANAAVDLIGETFTFSGDPGGSTTGRGRHITITSAGSNPIAAATGLRLDTFHGGTGLAALVHGIDMAGGISSSGNVTVLHHIRVRPAQYSSTGIAATVNGLSIGNLGHATLTGLARGIVVTDQTAGTSTPGATGIESQVVAGAGKISFYDSGGANNIFLGNTRIGSTTAPSATLDVTGTMAVSGTATFNGAVSASPSNANVTLSPTGTGTVTINPATAGAMDNMVIGATTPKAGTFASVTSQGSVLSNSATAGIGYATGAGGTVTQATSKSTGVTLNKVCGTITMNNASLASRTAVSFTLTNSAIAATDQVLVQHDSVGSIGNYGAFAQPASGSATITVYNNAASALGEAIVLRFVVIKAVTS